MCMNPVAEMCIDMSAHVQMFVFGFVKPLLITCFGQSNSNLATKTLKICARKFKLQGCESFVCSGTGKSMRMQHLGTVSLPSLDFAHTVIILAYLPFRELQIGHCADERG